MKLEDIVKERDDAKAKWQEHDRKALHFKELYATLEVLVRLKGGSNAEFELQPPTSNGHSQDGLTRKGALVNFIRDNGGLEASQIFEGLIAQGLDIKKQYVYNVLSWLVRDKVLRREEGKYYVKTA